MDGKEGSMGKMEGGRMVRREDEREHIYILTFPSYNASYCHQSVLSPAPL